MSHPMLSEPVLSPAPPIRVLMIDDNENDYLLVRDILAEASASLPAGEHYVRLKEYARSYRRARHYGSIYTVTWVDDYATGLEALLSGVPSAEAAQGYDVCLLDYRLGADTGLELLQEARGRGCDLPIILLTGQGDHEIDLAAMEAGATDYLSKDELTPALLERVVRYALVHHREMTERQQAEIAKQIHDERFHLVCQATDDVIWDWNIAGDTLWWNDGVETLFGYSPGDLEPGLASWTSRIHPADLERVQQSVHRALQGGPAGDQQVWSDEYRFQRADGSYADIFDRGYITRDAKGQPVRVIGSMQDISERKRAEAALWESNQRLRQVIKSAHCLLWQARVVQPEAGSDLQWQFSMLDEDGAMRFLPLERRAGESYGTTWHRSKLPEDQRAMQERATRAIRDGQPGYSQEFRCRLASGDMRWLKEDVEITGVAPLQWSLVGVCTDITEIKRAEAQLQQYANRLELSNKALARSNRELQEFAYVASHDLQEPLRKIRTFADAVQMRYGEQLDAQGQDYLDRMQRAAARMHLLIKDLLALSRVVTGNLPFEPVELTVLLKEVLSDLEIAIQETRATITCEALPAIEADPVQMRQLLQNLIGNALKFHKPGEPPQIQVTAHILEVSPDRHNQRSGAAHLCIVTVQDNGIGFDEKYLEKMFLPFQRLHGRSREYPGTGMGLAICRRIVERHGGSITAKSTPGAGSTFVVTLPMRQEPASLEPDGGVTHVSDLSQ